MLTEILLQIPQTADTASAASAGTQSSMSFLDLIIKGGPIMIPLLILSIATVYIFTERYIIINRASKPNDQQFLGTIRKFISEGMIDQALSHCKAVDYPIARMIDKGIRRIGKPIGDIESDIENTGKIEIYRMEKNISLLGTIAGIGPMFGFLGTIFGVIKIFYNISLADNISIGLIAGGLYEKMITSAAGLLVGIAAYLLHHFLMIRMERITVRMEQSGLEFIDILQEPTR
jgi:biopolymer transport protein ExbB